METRMRESLDAIFKPRSVAVVGASNNPKRWGYGTVSAMLAAGYREPIYPINPSEREVLGIRCYESVSQVPGEIDLAVIAVNAQSVTDVVRECIRTGVKGGIVIAGGFAEVGPEGEGLQRGLAREAAEAGFYFVGPNCWGIWSADGDVNTLFTDPPEKGPVSFVSQSGTLGEYLYNAASKCGFGVSKFISCGNQACITFTDYLEYLGDDASTRVVVGYVEEVADGRRFLEVARSVAARKPLLMYKAGSTREAARAARSHTAAMVGDDAIFDGVCRQAGIVRWHDVMELFHMAEGLCYQPLPKGDRVAILSWGGGFCVTAAEACSRLGMDLPELSPDAQAELLEHMRDFAPPPVNPVDCIARISNDAYLDIIEIVAKQDYIDGIILTPRMGRFGRNARPESMLKCIKQAQAISEIPERFGKPLICANEHELEGPVYEILKGRHIPFFDDPMECAVAMYGLVQYGRFRRRGT